MIAECSLSRPVKRIDAAGSAPRRRLLMTAEEAVLLADELARAVRDHLGGEERYIHLLSELKADFEHLGKSGGEGLVIGNVETGDVRFVYGSGWLREVEWMDDTDPKPVIEDRRKEADREGR
jgi:hypothetical protein